MQRPKSPELAQFAGVFEAVEWVTWIVRFVGPGFHPDSRFFEYVRDDGARSFTDEECDELESSLETAWRALDSAGMEIYAVALPVQRQLLGIGSTPALETCLGLKPPNP